MSLICMFCGKKQAQQETAPEPINFKSTFGCRWLLQSLALDGSEIAGVPVKAKELNRAQNTGQEEFPLSDFLDLEIKWQPELEKQVVEDRNDDGGGDNDFQVRDQSSLENVKRFEPVVRSTEDKSGGSSAIKTNDGLQDDLWSSSNSEKLGKSNQMHNGKVKATVHLITQPFMTKDDSFDAWNDFTGSTTVENPTNISEAKQFEVTAIVKHGGEVEKANNSSSRSIDLVQGGQLLTDNIEIPDNKVINEGDDSIQCLE
ncbi:hypothetical protein Patl1_01971 [Pistacia atlantica]|uniref:Uncharacterized protein n=1 Tax=Pistacia atlantica TaxID=434234 RepID=A0ACC1C6A5_9ROSI|nr:hypothetical protein Patl1_01971 [Pistacia atlantica]